MYSPNQEFICFLIWQDSPLAREMGKDCVAWDTENQLFLAKDCSDTLDLLCFIRQRLS